MYKAEWISSRKKNPILNTKNPKCTWEYMIYPCEKFLNNTWWYMFEGQIGLSPITVSMGFLVAQQWSIRLQCRSCRDAGLIPGSGRSSGEDHGNPLQYSCLGRPTVRRAWWAIAKSQTRLKQLSTHTHTHTHRGQCKWKHWNTGMALVCSKQASWAPAVCPCCGILRNKRNMELNCGEHSNRLKALSWR